MTANADTEQLPAEWAQRPTRRDRSYASSRGGVPVEDMVLLANLVGAAPWFTMPHTASDDYVRQFATHVRDALRPDVDVYVELSNEVWGTGHDAGVFCQDEGIRLALGEEGNAWCVPGGWECGEGQG